MKTFKIVIGESLDFQGYENATTVDIEAETLTEAENQIMGGDYF